MWSSLVVVVVVVVSIYNGWSSAKILVAVLIARKIRSEKYETRVWKKFDDCRFTMVFCHPFCTYATYQFNGVINRYLLLRPSHRRGRRFQPLGSLFRFAFHVFGMTTFFSACRRVHQNFHHEVWTLITFFQHWSRQKFLQYPWLFFSLVASCTDGFGKVLILWVDL